MFDLVMHIDVGAGKRREIGLRLFPRLVLDCWAKRPAITETQHRNKG